jgi:predicted transcriptional regulator
MSATTSADAMATTLSTRVDDDLEAALEEFRLQHEFPPDKSDVVRAALAQYLSDHLDRDVRA